MVQKITMLFLVLFILMAFGGMFIAIDTKIKSIEQEFESRLLIQKAELEEMKKAQRITAQDVDFLEKMIKEEL